MAGEHIHRCAKKAQEEWAQEELERLHPDRICQWNHCVEVHPSHASLGTHIQQHITSQTVRCHWGQCQQCVRDSNIVDHLYDVHKIRMHVRAEIKWCFICGKW